MKRFLYALALLGVAVLLAACDRSADRGKLLKYLNRVDDLQTLDARLSPGGDLYIREISLVDNHLTFTLDWTMRHQPEIVCTFEGVNSTDYSRIDWDPRGWEFITQIDGQIFDSEIDEGECVTREMRFSGAQTPGEIAYTLWDKMGWGFILLHEDGQGIHFRGTETRSAIELAPPDELFTTYSKQGLLYYSTRDAEFCSYEEYISTDIRCERLFENPVYYLGRDGIHGADLMWMLEAVREDPENISDNCYKVWAMDIFTHEITPMGIIYGKRLDGVAEFPDGVVLNVYSEQEGNEIIVYEWYRNRFVHMGKITSLFGWIDNLNGFLVIDDQNEPKIYQVPGMDDEYWFTKGMQF